MVQLEDDDLRQIRGNAISMIFQEPMTSLNPVFTIGFQISEAIMLHQGLNEKEAEQRALEMLRFVRIPEPDSPTTATVSPLLMWNDIPSTAFTVVSSKGK